MEVVDLDHIHTHARHLIGHRQPLLACFPGKAQYQVRSEMQRRLLDHLHRLPHCSIIVTSIHAAQGVVVDRFHAKLERNECLPAEILNHPDFFFIDAVGSRPDRQAYNLGVVDGLGVKTPEVFGFGIGVREWLEVDDELVSVETFPDIGNTVADLVAYRIRLDGGWRSKRTVVAIGTSAGCYRSIAVGAGKPGIDDDLINALSKPFLKPAIVAAEPL